MGNVTQSRKAVSGGFRLVVVVGRVEVPAHPGSVTRDRARALKAAYKLARPNAETRVRRAL